ncbi:MAG: hypothetical protein V1929_08540 [bacterium]
MMQQVDKQTGPVSRKVLAALEKELNRKVIDFESVRLGAERAKELERGVISDADMKDLDPLHAVYAFAQNKMSVMVEYLAELPMCAKLADTYSDAEEEYMPSGPPMSPLTSSYFFCWGVFDSSSGKAKETLGTVAIEVCRTLGTDSSLVRLFELMQDSRMGLYVHEGVVGSQVLLREFVTAKPYRCVVPAGYSGRPGEIWFARVLPEPFETTRMGYSLVFNTPYVICSEKGGRFVLADPKEWQAFLDRTIPKTGIKDAGKAYAHLMKYGLSSNYWNEYVFEAYVNHRQDMILLTGFPDVPSSRPHSQLNEAKMRQTP